MRKILLLAGILGMLHYSYAQFSEGQKIAGPVFSLNTNNSLAKNTSGGGNVLNKRGTANLGIGLSLLSIQSEKKAIGGTIMYNYSWDRVENSSNLSLEYRTNMSTIGFNVFTRNLYALTKNNKWYFFYDLGVGGNAGWGRTDYTLTSNPNSTRRYYNANGFVSPGVSYFIKENTLILDIQMQGLFAIQYTQYQDKIKSQNSQTNWNNFNVSSTLNANDFMRSIGFTLRWVL